MYVVVLVKDGSIWFEVQESRGRVWMDHVVPEFAFSLNYKTHTERKAPLSFTRECFPFYVHSRRVEAKTCTRTPHPELSTFE